MRSPDRVRDHARSLAQRGGRVKAGDGFVVAAEQRQQVPAHAVGGVEHETADRQDQQLAVVRLAGSPRAPLPTACRASSPRPRSPVPTRRDGTSPMAATRSHRLRSGRSGDRAPRTARAAIPKSSTNASGSPSSRVTAACIAAADVIASAADAKTAITPSPLCFTSSPPPRSIASVRSRSCTRRRTSNASSPSR